MIYFVVAIVVVAAGTWLWLWELQNDTGLSQKEWRMIDKETFRPGYPGKRD